MNKKHLEFTLASIKQMHKPPYKGIHVVYSGFNDMFRQHFGTDPQEATAALEKAGKIAICPCKGGAMLYRPEDAPENSTSKKLARVLASMK